MRERERNAATEREVVAVGTQLQRDRETQRRREKWSPSRRSGASRVGMEVVAVAGGTGLRRSESSRSRRKRETRGKFLKSDRSTLQNAD